MGAELQENKRLTEHEEPTRRKYVLALLRSPLIFQEINLVKGYKYTRPPSGCGDAFKLETRGNLEREAPEKAGGRIKFLFSAQFPPRLQLLDAEEFCTLQVQNSLFRHAHQQDCRIGVLDICADALKSRNCPSLRASLR